MLSAATNFGCVTWFRVEDLSDVVFGGHDKKQELLAYFKGEHRKPIVFITFMIISPDLHHDQWFFQHVIDKLVLPWVFSHLAPDIALHQLFGFSDGAPTQF